MWGLHVRWPHDTEPLLETAQSVMRMKASTRLIDCHGCGWVLSCTTSSKALVKSPKRSVWQLPCTWIQLDWRIFIDYSRVSQVKMKVPVLCLTAQNQVGSFENVSCDRVYLVVYHRRFRSCSADKNCVGGFVFLYLCFVMAAQVPVSWPDTIRPPDACLWHLPWSS